MKAEVVVAGLHVPEGPAVLPDGRIAFTEQTAGRISVLDGSAAVALVRTGGAANSCVVGTDGLLYLCQNGGVVGDWRAARPAVPAIQRATPGPVDQPVETLAVEVAGLPLVAPNDLAFGPDGRLYFTDPAQPFRPTAPAPVVRIFIASCTSHGISVLAPDGRHLDLIRLDPAANPTNCCFQGSSLWVTDFGMDWATRPGAGRLWRIETDAVAAPGHPGSLGPPSVPR